MKNHKRKHLMNIQTVIFVLMILVPVLTLILIKGNLSSAGDVLTITAKYITKEPNGVDDPVWQQAQSVQVSVEGREVISRGKGTVMTQVLYTDDRVYFRFKWKDPTRSIIKQSWTFDGEKWSHLEGNEDRIALLFEIARINKFASRGCAVTCHSPADLSKSEWKLATHTPAEKGDLWHWKAARSAPYRHADDAWLTVAGNPTGSYRETGRRKDKGNGGDRKNETDDGTRPKYMQEPTRQPLVPGFLLFEEAISIKDYSVFKSGDILPFRLPVKPSGSRFDVKAVSQYADGHWNVMLYRKLNTGHEDDVVFNPMKRYSFAMAVFDDSGADHSKATKAMVLRFSRK